MNATDATEYLKKVLRLPLTHSSNDEIKGKHVNPSSLKQYPILTYQHKPSVDHDNDKVFPVSDVISNDMSVHENANDKDEYDDVVLCLVTECILSLFRESARIRKCTIFEVEFTSTAIEAYLSILTVPTESCTNTTDIDGDGVQLLDLAEQTYQCLRQLIEHIPNTFEIVSSRTYDNFRIRKVHDQDDLPKQCDTCKDSFTCFTSFSDLSAVDLISVNDDYLVDIDFLALQAIEEYAVALANKYDIEKEDVDLTSKNIGLLLKKTLTDAGKMSLHEHIRLKYGGLKSFFKTHSTQFVMTKSKKNRFTFSVKMKR